MNNQNFAQPNFQPKPLPADPVAALQALSSMARNLITIAEEEAQVLVKDDWVTLSSLQDQKERVAWNYAHACEEFQNRIEDFRGADRRLIDKLDALQRELGEKTQNNNVMIMQMRERAMGNTRKTLLATQEIAQNHHIRWDEDQSQGEQA